MVQGGEEWGWGVRVVVGDALRRERDDISAIIHL